MDSNYVDVLDGFVRLDDSMVSDLSVVNSARVSFGKTSDELDDAGIGLINFLMRERHGTPFEHNAFRFHIKCPVFVAREWFRHRIGSFNEFSARYSEVPNEFHVPDVEHVRRQTGKPGAYLFEQMPKEDAESVVDIISEANQFAYGAYLDLLEAGVAKELARTILPMSMYTQFYWTVNARALMNFLSLRTHSTAQEEIRQYAHVIEDIFAESMPVTYEAWVVNAKVCP
jgi:thymidylate synthase (FAD)